MTNEGSSAAAAAGKIAPTIVDVRAAAQRLKGRITPTPLLEWRGCDAAFEVTELIGDVLTSVDAVSRAMMSEEEKVRDVSAVADQAQVALSDLLGAISRIKGLAGATAEISETQAARMTGLAERMANVASISSTSAKQADGAASAMATQQRTIGDLQAVSAQLAELAERVRGSIARFSVTAPNDSSARHD